MSSVVGRPPRRGGFVARGRSALPPDHIGIDNIAYEVDYPPSDCSFPGSPEDLREQIELAQYNDAEIARITHEKALRWLRFDPFAQVYRSRRRSSQSPPYRPMLCRRVRNRANPSESRSWRLASVAAEKAARCTRRPSATRPPAITPGALRRTSVPSPTPG